jgi:histone H4
MAEVTNNVNDSTSNTSNKPAKAAKVAKKTGVKKTAGKNNAASGANVAKRHANKKVAVGVSGIGNPGLRRLARKGGVKRTGEDAFQEGRQLLEKFVDTIVSDALLISEASGRKTVTVNDVSYSLKRNGHTLYGY